MDSKETRTFAQQLMKEVWEPFDSQAVSRFFHRDVDGWHRRADSSWQELSYDDVVNRLTWDKETNANPVFDVRDIIAEEDRFALRFLYAADFIPTGGKIGVEMMYFYHLRGDKVAEFWLLASVDFDFKAKGTEGTHKVTTFREGRRLLNKPPDRSVVPNQLKNAQKTGSGRPNGARKVHEGVFNTLAPSRRFVNRGSVSCYKLEAIPTSI